MPDCARSRSRSRSLLSLLQDTGRYARAPRTAAAAYSLSVGQDRHGLAVVASPRSHPSGAIASRNARNHRNASPSEAAHNLTDTLCARRPRAAGPGSCISWKPCTPPSAPPPPRLCSTLNCALSAPAAVPPPYKPLLPSARPASARQLPQHAVARSESPSNGKGPGCAGERRTNVCGTSSRLDHATSACQVTLHGGHVFGRSNGHG